jgi:hypothetical protein
VVFAFMTESSMSCPFVGSRAVRVDARRMGLAAALGKITGAIGKNAGLLSDNSL